MDEFFEEYEPGFEDDMSAEMVLLEEMEYKLRRVVAKCDLCEVETVATRQQFEDANWFIEKGVSVCPAHSQFWHYEKREVTK